ncbi:hypothetical protein M5D96_003925 [Drosophila gunungcola]|uniref:Uncharacterized protein n=2 Tax=Drosophila gunungcola TaxID=103775 RepID=A0A9P9YT51_9MUSC|nr:hypothetical protein M5D96_003925 [Drosophila gunungcola]
MLNEGMEALRQIATTSLFMQNEQKTAINRVVPIINEPDSGDAPLEMKKLQTALNACEMSDEEQDRDQDQEQQQQQKQIAKRTTATTAVTSSTTKDPTSTSAAGAGAGAATSRITRVSTLSTVDEKPDSKLVRQRVALQQQRHQEQQQHQVPKSQSLSSSSTVKDSLEVVEETSLIDASDEALQPVAVAVAVASPAATAALPSSCSTGAIPRLNRPGISTGATPKTTTTTTTPTITARLPTSQSHPTSYDLPPALPHTYSASATVRGPLGMSMSSSAGKVVGGTAFTNTSTTISLLPLPAPPAATATAAASIPGQVLESSGATSLSLSLMRPATASGVVLGGLTTSSFTTADHQKSHLSSAGSLMGRGSSLLPTTAVASTAAATSSTASSSKFEPELVLSPAKLGQ